MVTQELAQATVQEWQRIAARALREHEARVAVAKASGHPARLPRARARRLPILSFLLRRPSTAPAP